MQITGSPNHGFRNTRNLTFAQESRLNKTSPRVCVSNKQVISIRGGVSMSASEPRKGGFDIGFAAHIDRVYYKTRGFKSSLNRKRQFVHKIFVHNFCAP